MNYPKIIALYRLERKGMIYDYLNATTKKEARETIKNNGGIVYAILTMDEAYKLAFCTEGFYYQGFKGILNAKNDKKVEEVSDFLSQCFFYENDDIRMSYESTINYKIAKCEVKIAHYEAELKFWSKNDAWTEIIESYQKSIDKVQQEMAEINRKEEEKQAAKKEAEEFAKNVENMLKNNGLTIIDKKVNMFKNIKEEEEGHIEITAKNQNGEIVEISKYTGLWFTTVNDEYINDNQLADVIEEEYATKIDTESVENVETTEEYATKIDTESVENVETTEEMSKKDEKYLPDLGEKQFLSDYERYMNMAYDLAWQEEEEEEEDLSENDERCIST